MSMMNSPLSRNVRGSRHAWLLGCAVASTATAQAQVGTALELVVVTASRVASSVAEVPQRVEIVTAEEIERSVSLDLTDALKKNAGVDVIQYNGVLSGIGIRGFRPEFSGTNKRSLLLVDGRPPGTTNLATILLDDVERIEVLKGPASSLYGASAMGGVVNVITKRSTGELQGKVRAGLGSFDTVELAGSLGGALGRGVDIDVSAKRYDRGDDYTMGHGKGSVDNAGNNTSGKRRPFTQYTLDNARLRVGYQFNDAWRVDASGIGFRALDVLVPGDEFVGQTNQGKKDLHNNTADLRLNGALDNHTLEAVAYTATQKSNNTKVTSTNAADQSYLPFLNSESQNEWQGAQLRDTWDINTQWALTVGIDYEAVNSVSRSYTRTGARQGPFSADDRKTTVGVYAQQRLRLYEGRTTVSIGVRGDRIQTKTLETPYKTGFVPSATSFDTVNPSIGFTQQLLTGLRVRATYGTAFVPPSASQLTGFTTQVIGGVTQVTQGNPNLKPEKSRSYDAGIEWTTGPVQANAGYFRTRVSDRIASNVVIGTAPITLSYANAFRSNLEGIEADLAWQVFSALKADASVVHYLQRREQLSATTARDITNVAETTVRLGLSTELGKLDMRLQGRIVNGRTDQDFNVAGNPLITYPNLAVADAHVGYQFTDRFRAALDVNNVFDAYYFEKKGHALEGRYFMVRTTFTF